MRKVLDSEEYDELKQTDQDQIPEYKLLKAVLTRALQDYTGILKGRPSSKGPQISERDDVVKDRRRHAIAAEEWLFDDTEAPRGKFTHFTFRWICLHLDLDPQVIRREATRIKRFASLLRLESTTRRRQDDPKRQSFRVRKEATHRKHTDYPQNLGET